MTQNVGAGVQIPPLENLKKDNLGHKKPSIYERLTNKNSKLLDTYFVGQSMFVLLAALLGLAHTPTRLRGLFSGRN